MACQVAVHCRRAPDMGFMSLEAFRESLKASRSQPNFIPTTGSSAVLLRSGYAAHVQQARPPRDALSAPLPKSWGFAETVTVRDVSLFSFPVRGSCYDLDLVDWTL